MKITWFYAHNNNLYQDHLADDKLMLFSYYSNFCLGPLFLGLLLVGIRIIPCSSSVVWTTATDSCCGNLFCLWGIGGWIGICTRADPGLKKPTDLDLHCLQMQGISGFSRTRVKFVSDLQVFYTSVKPTEMKPISYNSICVMFTLKTWI